MGGALSAATVRYCMFRLPTLRKNKEKLPPKFGTDLRSLGPLHACPCGSKVFSILATFDNFEISWYMLDATCANCGNLIVVPCPVDDPAREI
jgi:hypothetical protein